MIKEYSIPVAIDISSLLGQIESYFPLVEGELTHIHKEYQDTFDWRLYNNGYIYFTEQCSDNKTIHSFAVNRPDKITSLGVDKLPLFSADIPDIKCFKQLKPFLDIRALMTHLSVVITRRSFSYTDKQGKTVIQLMLDEYRLLPRDGETHLLEKKIILVSENEYDGAVISFANFLRSQFNLQSSEQSLLLNGLKLLHRKPNDYSSKLNIKLQPDMCSDLGLKKVLLFCLDTIEANEAGSIEDLDSEFLHDFRVSVRRTRSILSQIRNIFPPSALETFAPEFDWLGSITGPTRDLHVYLLKFSSYQNALPEELRPHLQAMRLFLEKYQTAEHQAMVRQLTSSRFELLKSRWRDYLNLLDVQPDTLADAKVNIKHIADIHIWQAYRKVMKRGNKLTISSPDRQFHKLRISCKKLRYLLEFFKSLYPLEQLGILVNSLKVLQNNLGDYQDLSVQIDSINHYKSLMHDEKLLSNETEQAMTFLVEHFHDQIQEQRELFAQSFAHFSEPDHKNIFKSLFKLKK